MLHHQHQTRETGRGKEKKGRDGWEDERNTPQDQDPSAYSFSQANSKVFYIQGEFVILVYQERRVYISKNAGHTITDFN